MILKTWFLKQFTPTPNGYEGQFYVSFTTPRVLKYPFKHDSGSVCLQEITVLYWVWAQWIALPAGRASHSQRLLHSRKADLLTSQKQFLPPGPEPLRAFLAQNVISSWVWCLLAFGRETLSSHPQSLDLTQTITSSLAVLCPEPANCRSGDISTLSNV